MNNFSYLVKKQLNVSIRNWDKSCAYFWTNNKKSTVAFELTNDIVSDIIIENKSLLKKYKEHFIKNLNIIDNPIKISLASYDKEKDLLDKYNINYEIVDSSFKKCINLDTFQYPYSEYPLDAFGKILFQDISFIDKEDIEIIKSNGFDLEKLIKSVKTNDKKITDFIMSDENLLDISIDDDTFTIIKENLAKCPGIFSVYCLCNDNNFKNYVSYYMATFSSDKKLLKTANINESLLLVNQDDFETIMIDDMLKEVKDEVIENTKKFFDEYKKNFIDKLTDRELESEYEKVKNSYKSLENYISIKYEMNLDSYKEKLKNEIIQQLKYQYASDNFTYKKEPDINFNTEDIKETKDLLSLFFTDKKVFIDKITDITIKNNTWAFDDYFRYDYIKNNKDTLTTIKESILDIIKDDKYNSVTLNYTFPNGKHYSKKVKAVETKRNHLKKNLVQGYFYDIPIRAIDSITRYKHDLYNKNDVKGFEYPEEEQYKELKALRIYDYFDDKTYKNPDRMMDLISRDITNVKHLRKEVILNLDFLKLFLKKFDTQPLRYSNLIKDAEFIDLLIDKIDTALEEVHKNPENTTYKYLLGVSTDISWLSELPEEDYTLERIKKMYTFMKKNSIGDFDYVKKSITSVILEKLKDNIDDDIIKYLESEDLIPIMMTDYHSRIFKDKNIISKIFTTKSILFQIEKSNKDPDKEFVKYLLDKLKFEKESFNAISLIKFFNEDISIVKQLIELHNGDINNLYNTLKKMIEIDDDFTYELFALNPRFLNISDINDYLINNYVEGTVCSYNKISTNKETDNLSFFGAGIKYIKLETDLVNIYINNSDIIFEKDDTRIKLEHEGLINDQIIDALLYEIQERNNMSSKYNNIDELYADLKAKEDKSESLYF